jgi:DNA helicase-2/ATP-dependent DNA helicase PcrA
MPLDLIEDLSPGKSWLYFARGSTAIEYEHGEYRKEQKKFSGKTYNSVESIAEFFKQRNQQLGVANKPWERDRRFASKRSARGSDATDLSAEAGSAMADVQSSDFIPGSYVRHAKYGRGLVLRREGAGDSTKLTVSFPGYGQKKLVQKYAGLEKI